MKKKLMIKLAIFGLCFSLIFLLLFVSLVATMEQSYVASWKKLSYDSGARDGSATGEDLVAYALTFANKTPMYRYRLGGYKLSQKKGEGTDCAGFVSLIYAHFDLNTWGKINYVPSLWQALSKSGKKVKEKDMKPGDVIFFSEGSSLHHVAIYAGNNEIVHASDERVGIVKTPVSYSLMGGRRHISGVIRIINDDAGGAKAGVVKGKRTSYPSKNNPFFFSPKYNAFVGTAYGPPALTHNCTWYAYGRFGEILGRRPALPTGNADSWYGACTAYKKGRTPRVGAVVCWRYSNGSYGHVAVVEEIKSNGDIVTSNSGWRGAHFWMQVWTKSSGYSGNGSILQGFIYQP